MHAEQELDDGPSTSDRTAEHSPAGVDVPLATDGEDTIASLVTGTLGVVAYHLHPEQC
jgi:hypothetical protein